MATALILLTAALLTSGPGPLVPQELPVLQPIPALNLDNMEPGVRRQFVQARAQLQTALERAGADTLGPLYGRLGQLCLAYDFEPAASVCFANAQHLAPDDFRWAYYLGHLHHRTGDTERSAEHYRRAIALNSTYLPAHIGLADLMLEANRPDDAATALARALELDADGARVQVLLGRVAAMRRQPERALGHFQKALRLDPEASAVYYPMGMAYRALGEIEQARLALQRAGSQAARLQDPLLDGLDQWVTGARGANQAGDYASMAGRLDEARRQYQKAVDAAPQNAEFHLDLGAALLQLGDIEGAAAALQEALRLDPDLALAHYNMALLQARQGRDEDAAALLLQTLATHPAHADARLNLAAAYLRLGRFDEAAEQFSTLIAADPAAMGARFGRAVALMRLGRWTAAKDLLEESHNLRPDHGPCANALARLLAACPLDSLRDGPRSLTIAQRLAAAERSLHNVEALAMAWAETGHFDEAVRLQKQGLAAVRQAGMAAQTAQLAANLARYRQGLPCRAPLGD